MNRRLTVVGLVMALMLFGCNAWQGMVVDQNAAMLTAIELAAYNLGYYVGHSKTTDDDVAIATAYELARTGNLSPEQLSTALVQFKVDNPQLAGSMIIVLKQMGASFGADGGLVALSGIPVAYWDTAASGYKAGYEIGKAGMKSKVMVK